MQIIEGVPFSDEIAPLVNELINRLKKLSPGRVYGPPMLRMNEIRAEKTPGTNSRVYVRILPRPSLSGAEIIPPEWLKKKGEASRLLTKDCIDEVFMIIKGWYDRAC